MACSLIVLTSYFWVITNLLSLHQYSFNEYHKLAMAWYWWMFKYCTYTRLDHISILYGILITITMILHVNKDDIRYYHMDATHVMDLAWCHFSHPDIWLCNVGSAPHLLLDTVMQIGQHVYHYDKLFPGGGLHAYGSSLTAWWLSWISLMPHVLSL